MAALTLDELLKGPLREARAELERVYRTADDLKAHSEEALRLPKVAAFRKSLQDYISRAEQLAESIAGDNGIMVRAAANGAKAKTPTRVMHAWRVDAVCRQHLIPTVVATANIDEGSYDSQDGLEAALHNKQLTHADLTFSYHTERVEKGRIRCPEHPDMPTELKVVAKVHRVVQQPVLPLNVIENHIIEDMVALLYGTNSNGKGNHSKLKKKIEAAAAEVRAGLEVLLRVGAGGIYSSIYEALEQTRHRAITPAHIAKNADLGSEKLNPMFRQLMVHGMPDTSKYGWHAAWEIITRLTPQQRVEHLDKSALFGLIEILAGEYIRSPLIVTAQRTKGQSLVDKVTVAEHYDQLFTAFKDGKLRHYLDWLNNQLKIKVSMRELKENQPPHLDDIVGVQATVHSDTANYDYSNPHSIREEDRNAIREEAEKAYRVLWEVAAIPRDDRGYERLPSSTSGRKRGPPDTARPKFKGLQPARPNGLIIDLTPSANGGTFDDYFVAPKETGYRAMHMAVGAQQPELHGAVVELKIMPNSVENWQRHLEKEREGYKLARASQIAWLLHSGLLPEMEWEMNKLLLMPQDDYREPQILTQARSHRKAADHRQQRLAVHAGSR